MVFHFFCQVMFIICPKWQIKLVYHNLTLKKYSIDSKTSHSIAILFFLFNFSKFVFIFIQGGYPSPSNFFFWSNCRYLIKYGNEGKIYRHVWRSRENKFWLCSNSCVCWEICKPPLNFFFLHCEIEELWNFLTEKLPRFRLEFRWKLNKSPLFPSFFRIRQWFIQKCCHVGGIRAWQIM